jgi:hypothetical protein
MPFIALGLRDGSFIHTPRGFVENGAIERADDIAALRAQGYTLVPHTRKPALPTIEEIESREFFARERAKLQQQINKAYAGFLKPLRKRTHDPKAEFGNARDPKYRPD